MSAECPTNPDRLSEGTHPGNALTKVSPLALTPVPQVFRYRHEHYRELPESRAALQGHYPEAQTRDGIVPDGIQAQSEGKISRT